MKMLMSKLNLNESFISRIWEKPQNYTGLKTTEGHLVEVTDYGRRNYDSDPIILMPLYP